MTEIDVFISYKREERALAEAVATALKGEGYVVVTDLNIQKAENFGDSIDAMIQSARLVVVLWTKMSAGSDWVRKEAEEAEVLDKYFGVLIDNVDRTDLPFAVRNSQWLDISQGSVADGIPGLVAEVHRLVGPPQEIAEVAGRTSNLVESDLEFFQVVDQVGEVAGYRSYIKTYPNGVYSDTANKRIHQLSRWHTSLKRFPFINGVAAVSALIAAYFTAFPPVPPNVEDLRDDLERVQLEQEGLIASRANLETQLSEITLARDNIISERDSLKLQNTELRTEHDNLLGRFAAEGERMASLNAQLAVLSESRDSVQAELSESLQMLASVESTLSLTRMEIEKLTADGLSAEAKMELEKVAQGEIRNTIADLIIEKGVDSVPINVRPDNSIEIRANSGSMFKTGSAELTNWGSDFLEVLAEVLNGYQDQDIRVEGHTDDVPIGPALVRRFKSNWEMSVARAASAVRYLSSSGISPSRLSAVGYGEFSPITTNDTDAGREQNRRVEIVLLPTGD